jgi:hypothetical protein
MNSPQPILTLLLVFILTGCKMIAPIRSVNGGTTHVYVYDISCHDCPPAKSYHVWTDNELLIGGLIGKMMVVGGIGGFAYFIIKKRNEQNVDTTTHPT